MLVNEISVEATEATATVWYTTDCGSANSDTALPTAAAYTGTQTSGVKQSLTPGVYGTACNVNFIVTAGASAAAGKVTVTITTAQCTSGQNGSTADPHSVLLVVELEKHQTLPVCAELVLLLLIAEFVLLRVLLQGMVEMPPPRSVKPAPPLLKVVCVLLRALPLVKAPPPPPSSALPAPPLSMELIVWPPALLLEKLLTPPPRSALHAPPPLMDCTAGPPAPTQPKLPMPQPKYAPTAIPLALKVAQFTPSAPDVNPALMMVMLPLPYI